MNLRGDGTIFLKQLQYLAEVSSVVVVIIDCARCGDSSVLEAVMCLKEKQQNVLLFFSGQIEQEIKAVSKYLVMMYALWSTLMV